MIARAAQFEEELLVCEVPSPAPGPLAEPLPTSTRVLRRARPRLARLRPQEPVSAMSASPLSGGIDSALVALLATDAARAGTRHPGGDALAPLRRRDTGRRAGYRREPRLQAIEIPISAPMSAYEAALAGSFGAATDGGDAEPPPRDPTRPSEPDLAAENIQARIRGT